MDQRSTVGSIALDPSFRLKEAQLLGFTILIYKGEGSQTCSIIV